MIAIFTMMSLNWLVLVLLSTTAAAKILNVELNGPLSRQSPCIGGPSAGLGSTDLRLDYRSNETDYKWMEIRDGIKLNDSFEQPIPLSEGCVEFRLVQEEHGGGTCNCWEITLIQLNSTEILSDIEAACEDRASVPRSIVWTSEDLSSCSDAPAGPEVLETPFQTRASCPLSEPHLQVLFLLTLTCDPPENINEGIELSLRFGADRDWIPVAYFFHAANPNLILVIRGFQVENIALPLNSPYNYTLRVCGFTEPVQLRWLQTVAVAPPIQRDVWSLDDIIVSYQNGEGTESPLLEESFDTNITSWLEGNIRNGEVSTTCAGNSAPSLVFSPVAVTERGIISRSVKTRHLSVRKTTAEVTTPAAPTTQEVTTAISITSEEVTTAAPTMAEVSVITPNSDPAVMTLSQAESNILFLIRQNQNLSKILAMDPHDAINLLVESVNVDTESIVVLYLLGDILNRENSEEYSGEDNAQFIKAFLDAIGSLSCATQRKTNDGIVGSSLLNILDRFALEIFPTEGNASIGNIILVTKLASISSEGPVITTINSDDFAGSTDNIPKMSIQIPLELVKAFADASGVVRTVSFLYYNISCLFPGGIPGDNSTVLGSGIVSTALQCGDERCSTEDFELNTNVTITIQHSQQLEVEAGDFEVECVFWDFFNDSNSSILSIGQWSDRGCFRNDSLSNVSVTVCECDHLTHFAILLSAAPLNTTSAVTLSLEIIGYVGVSISLVAMALTILVFIGLKCIDSVEPMVSMRNFIHINLCISLGIAQIIFVAGIDKASGTKSVPAHCQAVAVLLHYFFLVTFMWMLMEGVVLYLALVKVFVKHQKRYMLTFTLSSYGLPLLYMSALTLPLGFALHKQNYGYAIACFLNPETYFVWAFIVPVIVILLANCGFFIMTLTIMWKRRTPENSKLRIWLRSSVSLVVIMGLTWIFGVLIVEVEQLLPLAYIYTILVAFQGLLIFLLFVVLSKQVREAYAKWWKRQVNESDVLKRHFGKNYSATSLSTVTSQNGNVAIQNLYASAPAPKQSLGCSEGRVGETVLGVTEMHVGGCATEISGCSKQEA